VAPPTALTSVGSAVGRATVVTLPSVCSAAGRATVATTAPPRGPILHVDHRPQDVSNGQSHARSGGRCGVAMLVCPLNSTGRMCDQQPQERVSLEIGTRGAPYGGAMKLSKQEKHSTSRGCVPARYAPRGHAARRGWSSPRPAPRRHSRLLARRQARGMAAPARALPPPCAPPPTPGAQTRPPTASSDATTSGGRATAPAAWRGARPRWDRRHDEAPPRA